MVGLVGLFLAPALSAACGWVGDVDAGADKFFRPIVFVHGFAGSGEQYEGPAKLFASNGYPPTWITNYDYNSTGPTGGVAPLDKFIDAVRARTGFDKVGVSDNVPSKAACVPRIQGANKLIWHNTVLDNDGGRRPKTR